MAKVTASQAKTLLSNLRRDISEVSDTVFLEWLNMANQDIYDIIASNDPEQIISEHSIKVLTTTNTYATPSDFRDVKSPGSGLFYTDTGGSTLAYLAYDAQTGNFAVGETVTGGTSGATGVVQSQTDNGTSGNLTLNTVSGTFSDNEALTGSIAGAATADGASISFNDTERKYAQTYRGAKQAGFWLDSSNQIRLTPENLVSTSFILRLFYVPELTEISAVDSTETQVPVKYKRFLQGLLDISFQIWMAEDTSEEINANSRYVNYLDQFADMINRTPGVYSIADTSTNL